MFLDWVRFSVSSYHIEQPRLLSGITRAEGSGHRLCSPTVRLLGWCGSMYQVSPQHPEEVSSTQYCLCKDTTPETPPSEEEEAKARSLVEKKSVINLLEAFAVAVKHYLRGEDGIYYQ